ncbi:MAG: nuclear transport factor 2 family protein [Proteobacteria bacterium]|nr:nuclear transport factor 2 family protein [Pseudomonadota bacterium]
MTRRALLALVSLAGLLAVGASAGAIERDDQMVREADQALFVALTKGDAAAVNPLLDPKFAWTDRDGRTLGTKAFLQALPQPGAQAGANPKLHLYGQVAVITSRLDNVYALRVWAKGRKHWRALAYHEVAVTESPRAAAPATGECDNPCRTVPYKPRNAAERAVFESWQALERAVVAGDGAAWAPHVADEFMVVSNVRAQDKPTRIAAVNRGGTTPPPLVSATVYDYGDTIVMTCLHQPHSGKPIHVTRVWVKRGGAWQMAISYQTVIQAASAKVG